ncbi:MAG TPA: hypothetical protein VNR90_03780 [Vicinamibacterales bacterium]|nr:hypothetical protein [Vicinamibacterales bacterium]
MAQHPRRASRTAAALLTLLAATATARADGPDGGAPADGGAAAVGPSAPVVPLDARTAEPAAPGIAEPVNTPEAPSERAARVATMMLATPAPVEEAPRPITRRLWFWLAVAAVVAGGVAIGIAAAHDPTRTRPECPPDYVCPP